MALFPDDFVLNIKSIVAVKGLGKISAVKNGTQDRIGPERQFIPVKSPYSYVLAGIEIDGIKFQRVEIRK